MSDTGRVALLGVDGGGTRTVAWAADADGRVVGRGEAGPSNIKAVGREAALGALDESIGGALRAAGDAITAAESACIGLAGFDRPEDRAILDAWSARGERFGRIAFVNDGDLALAAGTPEGHGIAVIAGTGSIAVGRTPDGRAARAGGWGHLLGDEGSAYRVALDGLRLVARRADGRDALRVLRSTTRQADVRPDPDPLTVALCRALGVDRPAQLVTAVYAPGFDRARIAGLAPVVVAAAADDPEVVGWVLEPAGFELGQAVRAVAVTLDWSEPDLPLAMAGGFLLGAEPVREAMLGYLKRFLHVPVVASEVTEPVRGALALARAALGGPRQ